MISSESDTFLFSGSSRYSSLSSHSRHSSYSQNSLSTVGIIFSIICLIVGLIYLFFGKRFIRFCTAFCGFSVFGTAALIITALTSTSATTITIATIIVGLFHAFVFGYFIKAGICLIGFCFGLSICSIILYFVGSVSLGLLIGLSIAFGIAGAILAYFKMDKMVVIGTAFLGSQIFMPGVSNLSNIAYLVDFTIDEEYLYYSSSGFWGMFIGSLILAGVGMAFQFYKFGKYQYLPTAKKTTESPV